MDFFDTHPYLLSTLIGLPAIVAAYFLSRPHGMTVLLAGAVEALHTPPLLYFNDTYWTPYRLGGSALGIEDFLVCFELGAGVWFAAIVGYRKALSYPPVGVPFVFRLLRIAIPTTLLATVVWMFGAGVMETLLIVMAATSIVILYFCRDLVGLSASALLLYPIYYLAVLYVTGLLTPEFFSIWDGRELWGISVYGLPLEEICFVIAISVCYPLIFGYALNARLDNMIR